MLIVAIHDVAPSTLDAVTWLVDRLTAAGVERRVVKVIPAEPGASQAGVDRLAAFVRREANAGSEIVQHGWSHRAEGPLRGGPTARARARLFAGDSAEFLTIDGAEMQRRLKGGRELLRGWGASVDGFCPPAWLATAELVPAARAAGIRYLAMLRGLRDLDRDRWLTLPPVGFMGTGGIQESLVQLGGRLVSGPLRHLMAADVHRVFLHPQGAQSSAACARVLDRITALAARHAATTYRELLNA